MRTAPFVLAAITFFVLAASTTTAHAQQTLPAPQPIAVTVNLQALKQASIESPLGPFAERDTYSATLAEGTNWKVSEDWTTIRSGSDRMSFHRTQLQFGPADGTQFFIGKVRGSKAEVSIGMTFHY